MRLIAKGYHQLVGIDYDETFNPIAKLPTICLIVAIVVAREWPLQQVDIDNAILHGSLTDIVFMQQPQGYTDLVHPNYVCQLHKAIYDLKQAPGAWFAQLTSWLIGYGFIASKADPSLFIFAHGDTCIYL